MVLNPLIWSVLLMLIGLALVGLEVFVPSGGLLGVLATGSVLASIGLAFYHEGPRIGLIFVMVAVVAVPAVLLTGLAVLPKTAVGKQLLLETPTSAEVLPDDDERRRLRDLIGKVGYAKSVMLPSGAVVVEGQTVDATSEGLPIEPGQPVRIVEVRGHRAVVRLVGPDDEQPAGPARADDLLSRPIDSLGIDFNEPLG